MLLTYISIELVLSVLLERFIFSLGTKEIYWKMNGPQIPVIRAPFGDGISPQVPLDIRAVIGDDFV